MKVTRLPIDPGPAAWNCILPPDPARPALEREQTADWLVIGAGFAGLAAARRLSQLDGGARIVVLEAKRVAEGPAGRNSGFMIDLPHDLSSDDYGGALESDLAQTADNRHAIAFAAEAAKDYGMTREAFDPAGKLNGAASEKGHRHNLDYAKHLAAMGEAHELYDTARMREITGTDYYLSGVFTPGAVMLQPALFVRELAAGLERDGVEIFENSPVLALEKGGDWVATTRQGSLRARKVILAVNGHLNSFGFMRSRLMHIHLYASMTRPLTADQSARLGGEARWGITPSDPMGSTVRRISGTGGDRIVVRNRFTFDPKIEVPEARIAAVTGDHDKAFAARFPMLGGVEMEHRWGGRLCLSLNNVQVIGELEEGLFSACVQNGLGTAKGTLAGVLAAEAACGVRSEALERALAAPQPRRLPPEPLSKIGATVRLRWSEWRAGREL